MKGDGIPLTPASGPLLPHKDSFAGLLVINVGLDLGVISPKGFTMLVIMAIVSTLITTPALRYYLPRVGPRAAIEPGQA
jgi:hypothetical protein